MDHDKALAILRLLSDGNDPETGKPFPPNSPYQRPDVIRALFHAVRELEGAPGEAKATTEQREQKKSARPMPGNAGKPWSKEEDAQLVTGFDGGTSIEDLAAAHGRSRIAIEARLAKFGKVPMPAGVRNSSNAPRASDIDRALYATQA